MAVIIREERTIGGKKFRDIKVYRSDKFAVTEETQKQAERLDEFLSKTLAEIRKEAGQKKLLKLKGKSGALDLWYFIGKKLQFVDDPKLIPPEDKKYVWRALWDHAGELAPGEMNSRSGTHRDHFLYCYRIAKFDKGDVERGGNWRAWVEFLDSPKIHSDERILDWIGAKMKTINKKNWVRILNRNVRQVLKDKDTSFYTKGELYALLEKVWNDLDKTEAK
ncbi:MAG: hypothetical protein AUJ39_00010 [Parcubacteria group bacterium CG1_02_42_13]|uniref:Uncharacterized protein n=1 Tax=Candidatus Portnoybacteria bacterium CG23_combo_of_CG06-09_8_20_14_all_37_13 TaxID=1974819 RepID=A0A2G9YD50_9BACT|nr:MAG: hypothetical protein AUJ39_00010 [Parcubacteria group bacterium CG1_02_42_13]PIP17166.1 MAG: hypothetical protein COX44_01380 [Candidatus Portnoybacteria bacterium CG23_combo_of_CG06-09_8_20_14_all_37_13]